MPLAQSLTVDGIELGAPSFWRRPLDERHAAFARLRAERPVAFHKEIEMSVAGAVQGPGFWSLTRYEDIREASRKPWLFSSADGITIGETQPEFLEFFGSMIVMDDPRHAKFRLLVQKGFTPKTVAQVNESVRVRARQLVVDARERGGECDFVEAFAAPLPLQVICDMLGVPAADEKQIFDWTNVILGVGDPDFGGSIEDLGAAALGMFSYAQALGQDRLTNPREDITSALMHAEVDGQRLTAAEFGSFFILLAVAGNETTRNAISWGAKMLTDHPDQRAAWMADPSLTPSAIEEIVRWSSPVIHMRRIATADTVIGGQEIAKGDKVAMWYWSGNRDESVFPDGHSFDVRRANSRDQEGYGAGGPHFCLGANLARREIQVMFEELFSGLPDLEITGEPDRLQSAFINGIKRMPCRLSV
ncbi:MAG: cytochrome P450 [Acidimicrobiales bacterium]